MNVSLAIPSPAAARPLPCCRLMLPAALITAIQSPPPDRANVHNLTLEYFLLSHNQKKISSLSHKN